MRDRVPGGLSATPANGPAARTLFARGLAKRIDEIIGRRLTELSTAELKKLFVLRKETVAR
jgi:hypothetical protein